MNQYFSFWVLHFAYKCFPYPRVISIFFCTLFLTKPQSLWALNSLTCKHAQLCSTLCNSMDCSLPGSSAPGISQARVLEWVAISFSRA